MEKTLKSILTVASILMCVASINHLKQYLNYARQRCSLFIEWHHEHRQWIPSLIQMTWLKTGSGGLHKNVHQALRLRVVISCHLVKQKRFLSQVYTNECGIWDKSCCAYYFPATCPVACDLHMTETVEGQFQHYYTIGLETGSMSGSRCEPL